MSTFTPVDHEGLPAFDARQLHAWLKSRAHFHVWIKERIEQYGFKEGEVFRTIQ